MYKLSEPFHSQALESFESRVLASETKFECSRVASRNARTCFDSRALASTRYARVGVSLLAAGTVSGCSGLINNLRGSNTKNLAI